MTISELWKICRENLLVILIATVLGVSLSGAYLAMTKPSYTATATAYVSVEMGDLNNATSVGSFVSASQLALQKTQAFLPLFSDRSTAEIVKTELGLADQSSAAISSRLRATSKQGTITISVSATESSPELAQKVADTAVLATSDRVADLEGPGSPVRVKLMSSAALSSPVQTPKKINMLAMGFAGGLLFGVLIALMIKFLDTKVRSEDDLKALTDKPVLAMIPESQTIARTGDASVDDGAFEHVRKLRTGLRYAKVDGEVNSYLFTSSMPGEGKSSLALSLARVFAMAGRDVVLVDGDLRRPTVHRSLNLSSAIGLSQLLAGSVGLEHALQESGIPRLKVIVAGDIVPNPSELLGSNRMKELLALLSQKYLVIIDGPPILPVTDSALLAGIADATVLVVKAGQTSKDEVARSIESLRSSGGYLAGLVLNRAKMREMSKYGYSAKYGHGYAPSEVKAAKKISRRRKS